jgi:shikimate kinase/3-dehydroquinate synthase
MSATRWFGHVALVGLPGAGKSSTGKPLAARLGLPFHDSDAAIVAAHGPIPELFAGQGEARFREIERETIAALLAGPPAVLALGGGAFANPQTRALVRRAATSVHLDAPLATLAMRVGDGRKRPLLAGDPVGKLAELSRTRAPAFALADLRVDARARSEARAEAVTAGLLAGPHSATVPVGDPEYAVRIGRGLMAGAGAAVAELGARRVLVVSDANVGPLHADPLLASLAAAGVDAALHIVPASEASKGWAELARLADACAARRLTRADAIVALGGGVVGDLAGFAAATWMRGLRWVQCPTTLLAQVDSSVGGKTAIDIDAGKNLVGAFHNPALVLADTALLDTLPARELACGLAEVIKYGLIDQPHFFDWLADHGPPLLDRDPLALHIAVTQSVRAKARIVTADPTEQGERALLNLGHSFAHALEAETGFGDALKHGEAVALGCCLAFRFSAAQGLCPPGDPPRVAAALAAAGLPTRLGDLGRTFDAAALVERIRGDKKAGPGGTLTLILAHGIGRAFVAHGIEPAVIEAFLRGEGAA